jgi:hypothetical protein
MNKTTPKSITGNEDWLDSRDIQERLEWLESFDDEDLTDEEKEEYNELYRFREYMIEHYDKDSWSWGFLFIRDEYFTEYAEEFANEVGAIDDKQYWLTKHIDWDAVASDMQDDYWEVDFFGNTYWTRVQ